MLKKSLLSLILLIPVLTFTQVLNADKYQYLLPSPNADMVTIEHNIAIRQGALLKESIIDSFEAKVFDSNGKNYAGEWTLSDDKKTLVFNHHEPFRPGEKITVFLKQLNPGEGTILPELRYSFQTRKKKIPSASRKSPENSYSIPLKHQPEYTKPYPKTEKRDIPDEFPDIEVTVSDNPLPGYIFAGPFGAWGMFEDQVPYLAILDNTGYPVYYKKLEKAGQDFKMHPTGKISYYTGGSVRKHVVMNQKMEIIDEYGCQNGYSTDFHDFLLLENGHALVLGYDDRVVDMDTVVEGGHEGVTVRGALIQELDSDKNVIFEWSSWDSFRITDAIDYVSLEHSSFIDYVHANAIEPTPDGGILVSCRNMSEITKIDKATGEIVWRLGGENDQFQYVNDTLGFSAQHDIRYHGNDTYSLFDNGWNNTNNQFSSAVEYQIHEEALTATQTKRLRSQPGDIYGHIMGNAQYIDSGRTIVGWGSGIPNITEFKADGSKTLEFSFEAINYRAFKYDFQQTRFYPSTDSLDFGYIQMNETAQKKITMINNSYEPIEINTVHFRSNKFYLATNLPITLEAEESKEIIIEFQPNGNQGLYTDIITLSQDITEGDNVERLSRQIHLNGYASETDGIQENQLHFIEIFPNPASEFITIKNNEEPLEIAINLKSTDGKTMLRKNTVLSGILKIGLSQIPSGIYILELKEEKQSVNRVLRKKLVVK